MNLAAAEPATDNCRVLRRIHVTTGLKIGPIELDSKQAHHVRDVLRLAAGDAVQAFDNAGNTAAAVIQRCDAAGVSVQVEQVAEAPGALRIVIASAVPKGERADWMIEKLSELGVERFVPLATARSVVLPKGRGKHERWVRIATESAKQSRRSGVMRIDELTPLEQAMEECDKGTSCFLSTEDDATPILHVRQSAMGNRQFFIGPEGGWSEDETTRFKSAGLTGVKLTATILRVETAAIAAAAIALAK